MDCIISQGENIREIEDIIDLQKANGNFTNRQVAFDIPSETDSTVAANLAKSLESGFSKREIECTQGTKFKKNRQRRRKSPLPDVVSWPSDSDITVLRMKLCNTNGEPTEKMGLVIPGDGLHLPDSSSMVNLATLMMQTQSRSKHSLIEEYLLPLSSWEEGHNEVDVEDTEMEEKDRNALEVKTSKECQVVKFDALCSRGNIMQKKCLVTKDSGTLPKNDAKCKLARFLRLYFCPCCTCLYKMEHLQDEPSECFTKSEIKMA